MASFVFSYRVPQDYKPGSPESVTAWTDWYAGLGAGVEVGQVAVPLAASGASAGRDA